jgi:hypothetical protein
MGRESREIGIFKSGSGEVFTNWNTEPDFPKGLRGSHNRLTLRHFSANLVVVGSLTAGSEFFEIGRPPTQIFVANFTVPSVNGPAFRYPWEGRGRRLRITLADREKPQAEITTLNSIRRGC